MSSEQEPDKSDFETHGWESPASGQPGSGSNDHGLKIRCPHCHNPIEVLADDAMQEQTCPSCGSHFSLTEDKSRNTAAQPTVRKLGQFELIEQLGVGAFGSVWKARDTELDRTVAIKIPRRDQLGPDEIEQFFREARAAAQLRHPNIVSVHEVGRDGNTVYIVSDLIRGVTLTDWLTGQQPTPKEAAKICEKIAVALDHAHERGVIHRDLKPGNVMLDGDGQPHIMDFGLAKREAGEITMTVEGRVLGTPAYMSPEQARGEGHTADRRTDVYSMGVILFELLTGELPFRGTPRMLLHQVLNEEPRTPRSLNDRVPRDLETICLKAMAKEPSRRYETTQALADDLNRWMKGEPIRARPVSRIERGWRWMKRNPMIATLGSILFASLVTTAVVSSLAAVRLKVLGDRETKERRRAEDREVRGRRLLYLADMKSAQEAWERRDSQRVIELLEGLRPEPGQYDVRTWDWHHLWNLTHSAAFTMRMADIQQVEFSPDGKLIAVAGKSKNSWFRERPAGMIHSFFNSTKNTMPDEWNEVSEVRIVDAEIGAVKATIPIGTETVYSIQENRWVDQKGPMNVERLVFSTDGIQLAIIGSTRVIIVDIKSNTSRVIEPNKPGVPAIKCLDISPDLKTLVVGYGLSGVALWDAKANQESMELTDHLNFSDDPTNAPKWDELNGGWINRQPTVAAVFSPDGKTIAIFSQDRSMISLWDVIENKVRATLTKFEVPVWPKRIAFSPDSSILATVTAPGQDTQKYGNKCEVKLWDVSTGNARASLGEWGYPPDLSFSVDGKKLAIGASKTQIWDVESARKLIELDNEQSSDQAIVEDGMTLVTAGGFGVGLWDIADPNYGGEKRKERRRLEGHLKHSDKFHSNFFKLQHSRDGRRIATIGSSYMRNDPQFEARNPQWTSEIPKEIKVWNLTRLPKPLAIASREMQEIAFSNDNSFFVTRETNNVAIWDRASGAKRALLIDQYPRSWNGEGIHPIAHSTERNSVVTASDITTDGYGKSAKVWDIESGNLQATLTGHESWVYGVAYSPDGKVIVTVSDDRTARLWDAVSFDLRAVLKPSTSWIQSVSFSPDSSRLITGSIDGTVKIWNVANGLERAVLSGHKNSIVKISFASDGKTIATHDQPSDYDKPKTIKLWNATNGNEIVSCSWPNLKDLVFSPDGSSAAVFGSYDHFSIRDTRTGKETKRAPAHNYGISTVVYSPDGTVIAHAPSHGSLQIYVWDAATLELRETLSTVRRNEYLSFSPDSQTLVAGQEGGVQAWDTTNYRERFRSNETGMHRVTKITFSSDSQWFVAEDGSIPSVPWIVETSSGKVLPKLEKSSQSDFYGFSADGKRWITGDIYNGVSLWDATTHQQHATLVYQFNNGFKVNAIAISPDSRTVVSATTDKDRSVVIWDGMTGKEKAILQDNGNIVEKVVISANSKILATLRAGEVQKVGFGSTETNVGGRVDLWDLASGRKRTLDYGNHSPTDATCLAFSPNGKWLLIGTKNSSSPAMLFEPASGKLLRTLVLNKGQVQLAAFSPDGQILAESSGDRTVRLWNTNSWTEVGSVDGQIDVKELRFSSDGKSLLTYENDGHWSVWDPFLLRERQTMELVAKTELSKHGGITSGGRVTFSSMASPREPNAKWIGFSPDGRTLAAIHSFGSHTRGKPDPNVFLIGTGSTGGPTNPDISSATRVKSTQANDPKGLWHTLQDEKLAGAKRFESAIVLVQSVPNDERWEDVASFIVDQLANASPESVKQWRPLFRPVSVRLVDLLAGIHRDRNRASHQRTAAAYLLSDYWQADPMKLAIATIDSDEVSGFSYFLEALEAQSSSDQAKAAKDFLISEIQTPMPVHLIKTNEQLAIEEQQLRDVYLNRKALAAVTLVQLGIGDEVWPMLKFSPDPSLRSLLIHHFGKLKTPYDTLAARLAIETEASIRQALIQSLGGLDVTLIPPDDRSRIANQLQTLYEHDPDAGIHASASWTLRKWDVLLPELTIGEPVPTEEQQSKTNKLAADVEVIRQRIVTAEQELPLRQAEWEKHLREHPATFPPLLNEGLIAHFPLDETDGRQIANDVAGQPGGVYAGPDQPEWVPGIIGNAVQLNGSGGHFDCGQGFNPERTDAFSYGCWFFAVANSSRGCLIGKYDIDAERGFAILVDPQKRTLSALCFHHWPDNRLSVSLTDQSIGACWHHCFVVHDGSSSAAKTKLLLDGEVVTVEFDADSLSSTIQNSFPIRIGMRNEGRWGFPFQGRIDDVRIYNRVLSEEDVQQLFESGLQALANIPAETRTPEQQAVLAKSYPARDEPLQQLVSQLSAAKSALHDVLWEGVRRWHVNPQGQTMVVIPNTAEFGETPIDYSFAIAGHETTVAEFRRFREKHVVDPKTATNDDCPVHNVSWYEAAEYCNWLSQQQGIPEDQWIYQLNEKGRYDNGMLIKENYATLTGYRLPSRAEWEYACRAGTSGSYSFGESLALIKNYGWHALDYYSGHSYPVESLLPNAVGLFDMHGNIREWTQDPSADPLSPVKADVPRELRGGSFSSPASEILSKLQNSNNVPTHRSNTIGFRVAKTLPSLSSQSIAMAQKQSELEKSNVVATGSHKLIFSGNNDCVVIPRLRYDGSSPITLEALVIPFAGCRDIASVVGNTQISGVSIDYTSAAWRFNVNDGRERELGYAFVDSDKQPELSTQVHVAGVFDGKELSIFVDGKRQLTSALTVAPHHASSLDFMIGADPDGNGNSEHFFNGMIDEVRISKVARYSEDFQPSQEKFEPDADTLVLYHFDEGQGQVAHDASSNHFDGKIHGAKWVKGTD